MENLPVEIFVVFKFRVFILKSVDFLKKYFFLTFTGIQYVCIRAKLCVYVYVQNCVYIQCVCIRAKLCVYVQNCVYNVFVYVQNCVYSRVLW